MATSDLFNSTLLGLYVGGTLISNSQSFDLTLDNETFDVTNKDSGGWAEKLPGVRSWSMSGSAFLAFDSTYTIDDLYALISGRTVSNLRFSTEISGDLYYHGNGYLTNINVTAGTEDGVTYDFSFEGTGALTESTRT